MTYSIDGKWLCRDGVRVLYCPTETPEQLEALRDKYQAEADAPPVDPPWN